MRTSLVAAVVALSLSFGAAEASDQWQTYRDPDGTFSVEISQPFAITHETTETEGHKLPKTQYMIDLGNVALLVRIGNYEAMPLDPEGSVAAGAKGFAEGHKLISDDVETLDGHAGRSLKVLDSDGYTMTDRIFYFDDRLIQAVIVAKGATPEQAAIMERFNATFHLK